MTDNGLDDSVVLGLRRGEGGEEGGGHESAVELEGEECGVEVVLRGADVVEEAGDGVGAGRDGPVRELGVKYGAAWMAVSEEVVIWILRVGNEVVCMTGDDDWNYRTGMETVTTRFGG